jgi:hypothetical protein
MEILLAGMLFACTNVSRLEKDSLVAHGELLDGAQEPLYYTIFVDFKKSVDTRIMSSLIKLSKDVPPLSLAELRPELVAQYLPPFIPPPQWPESWKQKYKEDDAYAGSGFHINFKNGRLSSVGICSHCSGDREYPIVGTPDGQKFYELPLTEKQVTEVFGSPIRIYKVHEVRY